MKQFNLFNLNKSSRCNSRYIAMPQLMQRVVAILVLAFVCGEVWAGDYVIFNGTYYLDGSTDGAYGSSLPGISTFNPQTCIWTGTSGGKFKNEKGYYLYHSGGYATISSSNSATCNITGSEKGTTGQKMEIIGTSYASYKYLYRGSSYWDLSNSSSNAATCVFAVTTDNTHVNGSSVDPTISGDKKFTTKGESYTF